MESNQHCDDTGESARVDGPLIERVAGFYHKALKGAHKARGWLKRQGLDGDGLQEQGCWA